MAKAPIRRLLDKAFGGASGRVFRGMATLALGTGLGRLIGIASIPVLTRLYGPEDFGVLAVFTAIVTILAPIVTLRYVLAMPLPRHDGVAMNLLALSLLLMACFTGLIAVALWSAAPVLLALLSAEVLASWWWLIVLGVVAAATYELLTYWAMRERKYKVIATTQVWQSAAGETVKIGLGLFALKPVGLLIGQVVAQGGGVTVLWRSLAKSLRDNWKHVRPSVMRKSAWRHRGFVFYRVPSQVLLVFSSQAPVIFVAALFDADTTGQLALAIMTVTLPVTLLGRTTAKAFYAEASRLGARRPLEVREMLLDTLKRLAALAVAPALLLMIFGAELFPLVFGDDWVLAGVFASSLAIFMLFQFLQAPVARVFYIFDGQRPLLYLNLQRTILIAVTFGAVYLLQWSAVAAIWCYSLLLAIHYALSIVYAVRFIPHEANS